MKSFPREEIISAQYETGVTVQCEASGFPRPTVTFLINGVNSYAVNKGHTIMEPYKTTVTYVVTMPSDVECHISNRKGNTFWRIKVNLKGKSFNKKFKSRVWMRYMFRVHHFSISFYGNSLKSLHEKGICCMEKSDFSDGLKYVVYVFHTVWFLSDDQHNSKRTWFSIFFFLIDDDLSFLKAVLRLTDETFTSDLKDPLSEKFKTLSAWLENILMSLYTEVHGFRDVEVVRFR